MSKEIYISSTPHETRLAIVEKDELSEIYYERENEYTLAGSIYNGRVTRVLPGMQSAFVDVGLERDAFLYITDFMEEQGDAADFEGASETKRGGERPERSGERSPERRGRSERAGERPERSGERSERGGERSERSGRRGDRGARPGGGEVRDASAASAERAPRQEAAPKPAEADFSPDEEMEGVPSTSAATGEAEDAEGSRRWRGRRGRRRGRSGEPRTAAAFGTDTAEAQPAFPAEEAESAVLEDLQGSAEPVQMQAEAAAPAGRQREDRGRGRGGRDRDRGRGRERSGERSGERGGSAQPANEPRAASSGDDADPAMPISQAEPFILPGESLSKYRRGGDAETQASASVTSRPQATLLTAKPSSQVDLSLAGWDGSAVLPGETLSRRRGREPESGREPQSREFGATSRPEAAQPTQFAQPEQPTERERGGEEASSGDSGGRNRRRDRDRRSNRRSGDEAATQETSSEIPTEYRSGVASREALEPIDAVQPGITSGHEPEPSDLSSSLDLPLGTAVFDLNASAAAEDFSSFDEVAPTAAASESQGETLPQDVFYETSTDTVVSFEQGPSEALLEAVEQLHETVAASAEPHATEDFHEETTEYEPGEDASATYRVDPAGPSEFRQSGLIEDDLNSAQVRFDEGSEVAQEGSTHEFTAIQPTGEMLSELPGEVAVPGAGEDPANPIEHETAVQSAFLADADAIPNSTAQAAEAGVAHEAGELGQGQTQAFAPGDGELEEELLDDDELGMLDVAASYSDDTEEETFEAGAEIGSMVRDRALDQLTSLMPAEEDEEDDFDIAEEEMEEDELDGTGELGNEADLTEEEDFTDDHEREGVLSFEEAGEKPAAAAMGEFPEFAEEPAGQRESRHEGRGEPRRGEGGDRSGRGSGRDRGGRGGRDSRGMANSRSNGGRPSRHSMQTTDLPAISDLLKPGQEVLVQIAKEPIAKKGARITSHIALPGRFLVFMPTVNHIGVSRKIESDGERRRLKEVLLSEKGEASGGFIVRTAASGATEEELRSDLRFLLNLWADIKQRSESSKSPALIYHDLNLVERILRDQVTDNFSAIWCDTEAEYERVLRFLQRFQPSLMRRVKLYTKDTPLFEQFGITDEINKALHSKVWLKSGGSIVINQTEALVAIDINTGKYVGKTARLEDTIVKTNLDAIPEIVRQIRLRDLGGIIVIDFIDMDDRKNRHKVLAALEEELKSDRAPSKVLQFNDFGLVAITRKRVKQSLERTLSTTCAICAGTGMTKSPITVCNEIYVELRKMNKQLDKGDVMLRVNPEVVKQLKSGNGKWLQDMEEIAGKTILIKSDPSLHPEQFDIH